MHSTSQSANEFSFNVRTFEASLVQTLQNEWVDNSSCTHHMANDASLFTSLDYSLEKKIYIVDDFGLDITGHGNVAC